MSWDPNFIKTLTQAVDDYDRQRAQELCTAFLIELRRTDDVYPETEAKRVLQILRNKRYFDLMQQVADGFLQAGQDTPQIRRQYAQALLDQSNLFAAIYILCDLLNDVQTPPSERAEAKGLLGRAYKQFYIDADSARPRRNQDYLKQAIQFYYEIYESNVETYTWQGINAVALIKRAEQDNVTVQDMPAPGQLAKQIHDTIQDKDIARSASMWDFATAAEACLALRRYDEALEWLVRYTQDRYADAFELSGTLRQFTEVWQLKEEGQPGALKLLSVLEAALLQKAGSKIELTASADSVHSLKSLTRDQGFEKVLGDDGFVRFEWFTTAMERARAVARVEKAGSGRKIGTGFLVQGKDLHESLGDELLFLTNAHVITDNPDERGALPPDQAIVNFQLLEEKVPVKEIVWTSPKDKLDATLVRLEQPQGTVSPYPVAKYPPLPDVGRVYVIGHPSGSELSFSINDNKVLDHEAPFIHYRAPTEPGSSGSPVFNGDWDLVGLHHAGALKMPKLHNKDGTYPANEGILMQTIREAIGKALGT